MALTGNWANKYGYFSVFKDTPNDPSSMNYGGSCAERIENLRARGYGLYTSVYDQRYSIAYWQQNCSRLKEEERLSKIQEENERLLNIQKKEEQILLDIQTQQEQKLLSIQKEQEEKLQQIKDQEITFNEQTNSGDFNETPITDVNVNSGCSECTGTELSSKIILKEGYHIMPDGSMMKDSDMEKGNNMKIAGIAAAGVIGVIGLLLYTKGGLK
jgi:hypothetical protein